MHKQVQTSLGEVTVSTPRDRDSSFDPRFIKKRETILAESVSGRIVGLYALGNSTREISNWMEENLGNRVSADTISSITYRVLPEIKAWKTRSLESVYPIVFMDAIHYKRPLHNSIWLSFSSFLGIFLCLPRLFIGISTYFLLHLL